jgi:hypothetical protein
MKTIRKWKLILHIGNPLVEVERDFKGICYTPFQIMGSTKRKFSLGWYLFKNLLSAVWENIYFLFGKRFKK